MAVTNEVDGPHFQVGVVMHTNGADVDLLNFKRIQAIHPHWSGFLRLSNDDNIAVHEGSGNEGTYQSSGQTLTVSWEKYGPDVFVEQSGIYVHERLIREVPRAEHMFAISIGDIPVTAVKTSVLVPNSTYEVSLRLRTSDIPTFNQVFIRREYESANLPQGADVIVDLGANIGLATIFFGLKYRGASILSVEPEDGNFAAMIGNIEALGLRVQKRQAAVWKTNGSVNLHTESESGASLDAWGVQVSDRVDGSNRITKCYNIGTLMDDAGLATVDILKIDIEGAELEVFSSGAEEWLPRVTLIIIETHDRFRPGSDLAVRKALQSEFVELPASGENLFFRRKSS
jgi:FkbM family methyltransferase